MKLSRKIISLFIPITIATVSLTSGIFLSNDNIVVAKTRVARVEETSLLPDVQVNGIQVTGGFADRTVSELLENPTNSFFLEQAKSFIISNFNKIIQNYPNVVSESDITINRFQNADSSIANAISLSFTLKRCIDSNGQTVDKQFSIIVWGFSEPSQEQTTGKTVTAINLSSLPISFNANLSNYQNYYAQDLANNGTLNNKFSEDLIRLINENASFFFNNPPSSAANLPIVKKNTRLTINTYTLGTNKNVLIVNGTFLSIPKNPSTPVDENAYRSDIQITITDFNINKTVARQNVIADQNFTQYTAQYVFENRYYEFGNWIMSKEPSFFLKNLPDQIFIQSVKSIQLNNNNSLNVILEVINTANNDGTINKGVSNISVNITGFNQPTITTSIKFTHQTIDVSSIDSDSPYEMDYFNSLYKHDKEQLIRAYVNDNYRNIFDTLPPEWKPQYTSVNIVKLNTNVYAETTIYGLENGNLVDNLVVRFNLQFKNPDTTRLIDVIETTTKNYVQVWPSWTNSIITNYYITLKTNIANAIYDNYKFYPKTITNSTNSIYDMIYLDKDKFTFTTNSVIIGSNAVSINENGLSLNLIGEISISRNSQELNVTQFSWITITLFSLVTFIILLAIILSIIYISRIKKMNRYK